MSVGGDDLGCILDILKVNVIGGANDNAHCAGDRGLKQRAGNCCVRSALGLVLALGSADAHVSVACVLHNAGNIGKIEVDEAGDLYKLGDALNALKQHFVRLGKSLCDSLFLLIERTEPVVGDNDKAVNVLGELCNALLSLDHSSPALKLKGLGNDADGKAAHVFGDLSDNGSCACAGAAAHACGDEYHIGALESVGDGISALLGGLSADLRLAACALTVSRFLAYLDLMGRLGVNKHLLVRVNGDKLSTENTRGDHPVDGVSAAAADAYNFYLNRTFKIVVNFKCHLV